MKVTAAPHVREARRAAIANKPKRPRGRPRKHVRTSPPDDSPVPWKRPALAGEPAADLELGGKASGVCKTCKAPYSDGEGFCGSCGTSLDGEHCESCDAVRKPGSPFCANCGFKFEAKTISIPRDDADRCGIFATAPASTPAVAAAGAAAASEGAAATAAPAPIATGPVKRPLFTKLFVATAWIGIAVQTKELLGDDFRSLDQGEIDMLVDATQEVLDKRVNIAGDNADLWRLGVTLGVVVVPRLFVMGVRARKKHARQLADEKARAVAAHVEATPESTAPRAATDVQP